MSTYEVEPAGHGSDRETEPPEFCAEIPGAKPGCWFPSLMQDYYDLLHPDDPRRNYFKSAIEKGLVKP